MDPQSSLCLTISLCVDHDSIRISSPQETTVSTVLPSQGSSSVFLNVTCTNSETQRGLLKYISGLCQQTALCCVLWLLL